MSFFDYLKRNIKNHLIFFIVLMGIVVLDVLVIIYQPHGTGVTELSALYASQKFGLSLQAVIFIYAITFFLLYRWKVTGKSNVSTFTWAIAFALYGCVFIGMLLESVKVPWAASSNPIGFFWWRQFMILWVALMYYGISTILTDNKKLRIVPAILMIAAGYSLFAIGLFSQTGDASALINNTMYAFLYSLWVPLCAVVAYSFLLYGRQAGLASPKILTAGFALLGITYLGWAPWHFSDVIYIYFIWFALFDVSLAIIMLGYLVLPYEIRAKEKQESKR